MKKITLKELLNLYYISTFSNKTNKVNHNYYRSYSNFFDKYTDFKYEQFINPEYFVELTNYEPIYKKTVLFIQELILNNSNNEKFKQFDFLEDKEFLPFFVNTVQENNKNETFFISDEDHLRLCNYFITAYFYDRQRFKFVIAKNDVLKHIPEEIHQSFNDLSRKLNGKRITGSTMSSFANLREYFDLSDERLGLVKK